MFQRIMCSLVLSLFFSSPSALSQSPHCDLFDAACNRHQQLFAQVAGVRAAEQQPIKSRNCNFQDIWLIPGRADASCTRTDAKKLVDIDPRHVTIRPPVVKFPGCFTVEIKNVHIHDNKDVLSSSFFAKSEYQWLNVKEFGEVKCQNASNNGCGGYGNNCYYCDICESLKNIDTTSSVSSSLSEQFKGLNCPRKSGYYTFRKDFCFNDWSSFDTNGDCRMDFFDSDKSDIKSALSSLQQIGYIPKLPTSNLRITVVGQRTVHDGHSWWRFSLCDRDINKGQFEKFQQWYVEYRKNIWHREEYLPWLLYENEISCLRLTFDVCERLPRQRPYGGQGYTCD